MSYISADKFYSPILKKIATGDVSVFLDASNVELKVAESYRNVKWRPLYLACNNGHLNVLNRLLEIPEVIVNATSLECYALRMAAENGHLNIVNRLLEIPQVLANAAAHDNYGLRASAHLGHLNVVRRLLEIPVVVVNAATGNHASLRMSSDNGYNEIAYIMAKIQWPRGAIDMPSYLHQYLPAIYQGAKIASGRQEFEGIVKCWIRGTSASNTNDIHYPSHDKPSQNLIRIDKYNAPRAIMQYAGCSDVVTEAINKDRVDYGMNTLLYSSHLHKTFQAAYQEGKKQNNKRSGYGQAAMVVYRPDKPKRPCM